MSLTIESYDSRNDSIGLVATAIFMLPFYFLVLCAYLTGIVHYIINLIHTEGHEIRTTIICFVIVCLLLLSMMPIYCKYLSFIMKKYSWDTQDQQQTVVKEN